MPSTAMSPSSRFRSFLRRRRWGLRLLANLGVAVAATAVALAGAELAVRAFSPLRCHPLVPSGERGLFWEYDELLGWKHRPGATGRFEKLAAFSTTVTINSRG